ncbi:MAG: immunity 53 family protein [Pyrinomonadaceae bacterium]
MNNAVIDWIQQWYAQECNGDWEHQYGIKVDTLDNPGWKVCIDLTDTELENTAFTPVEIHRNDHDWVVCRLEEKMGEKQFWGYGGPRNLIELFTVFRSWVEDGNKPK